MERALIKASLIIAIAIIISTVIFIFGTRYYLKTTSRFTAYKIDRISGKTWLITASNSNIVKE